jgi:PAS domain S-box-containing protein
VGHAIGFACSSRPAARGEQPPLVGDALFRALIEHGFEGINLLDAQANVIYSSPGNQRLLGYEPDDTQWRSGFAFAHPDDLASAMSNWRRVLENPQMVFTTRMRIRHKDGSWRWTEATVRNLLHDPAVQGIVVNWRDVTQQQSAETELQITAGLLQAVADGTTDAIFVKDRQGKYLFFNRAAGQFVGRPAAEVVGQDDTALFDDDSASRIIERDNWVMDSGQVDTAEEELTAAGVTRTYQATKAPYRDATGQTIGLIGIARDITAAKHAEQALRDSEERYRRLVELLPDAVYINCHGQIVFCNPAFVRLMGAADASAVLGKSPFEVFAPCTHSLMADRIKQMHDLGQPAPRIETEIVRLDGRPLAVHVSAAPIAYAGQPAILVVLHDLTELRRSAELLRSVLHNVADAIITIDERGVIDSANPAAERLFGYTAAELIGQNVTILMPVSSHSEHARIADYLRSGVAELIGQGREVECRRRDETTFPAELSVSEFQLNDTRHFTGIVRDVTARKRLEEQFRQSQKMEAIGRLAGGVAHDFNNLLTVILGFSDLLLNEPPAEPGQRESLEAIRAAGERAAALTKQLLAFGRKALIEPRIIDLNHTVEQIEKLLRRLIGEDIELCLHLDRTLPPVTVDPGQIEQVLMNLVVNARDAMPQGGRLTIETQAVRELGEPHAPHADVAPGEYAQLTVSDTGEGMTAEMQLRIFDPFYTTKEAGKGTGLGLAVVHGIVKQNGGHIEVQSQLGEGTAFRVLLPAAQAGLPSPAVASEALPDERGTETILLVEDEDAVRTIARLALEARGYQVIAAASGHHALQLLADHHRLTGMPLPLDLVVTDVVMPGQSGPQLVAALQASFPNLKVVYLSGYTDDAVVRHGLAHADAGFLSKPYTARSLAHKVREVLAARRPD